MEKAYKALPDSKPLPWELMEPAYPKVGNILKVPPEHASPKRPPLACGSISSLSHQIDPPQHLHPHPHTNPQSPSSRTVRTHSPARTRADARCARVTVTHEPQPACARARGLGHPNKQVPAHALHTRRRRCTSTSSGWSATAPSS
jgi:hypothetical protein